MSQFAPRTGVSPVTTTGDLAVTFEVTTDYTRIPGLYRLWDLQFVLSPGADYEVQYAEMTGDGTPLFMVFRRPMTPRTGRLQ